MSKADRAQLAELVRRFTDAFNRDDLDDVMSFFTEAARRGVLFHPNHCWFVSLAHTDEDVAETLDAARKSMKRAKRRAAQRPLISIM